ncbi:MAG TPA: hypothetical protein VF407_15490, partial [Polyangiaceae bacterium]
KVLAELRALVKVAPTMTDPGKDLPRVYWHGKNGAYLSFEPNASHVDATCEVSLADNALQAAAINNDPNVEPYHR